MYVIDYLKGFFRAFGPSFKRGYTIEAEHGFNAALEDTFRPQEFHAVQAFERDGSGQLVPASESRRHKTADFAIAAAKHLAPRYAGVIAWTQTMEVSTADYGPPTVLFQSGEVPDME